MSIDELELTEAHWLWYESLGWFGAGWSILLPSGLTAVVEAQTGDVSGLP